MKTKGLFWRYPRKISLLKELAGAFWRAAGRFLAVNACWLMSKVVKELKNQSCYQTANVAVIMLSVLRCPGQGKNRLVHGGQEMAGRRWVNGKDCAEVLRPAGDGAGLQDDSQGLILILLVSLKT